MQSTRWRFTGQLSRLLINSVNKYRNKRIALRLSVTNLENAERKNIMRMSCSLHFFVPLRYQSFLSVEFIVMLLYYDAARDFITYELFLFLSPSDNDKSPWLIENSSTKILDSFKKVLLLKGKTLGLDSR